MRPMFQRWLVVLCVCAVSGSLSACKGCGAPPIKPIDQCVGVEGAKADSPNACDDTTVCGDHYGCKDVKEKAGVKCCVFVDRLCTSDGDCCPGQGCQTARSPPRCGDRFNECTTDVDCGDVGDRACEDWTEPSGAVTKRCRHKSCGALGECPSGQSCFQGECVGALPCGGTCQAGEGCVPSAGRCQNYANPTGRPEAACPMTCNAGFIATFNPKRQNATDKSNIWDSCKLPDVKCVCAELPGLQSNDLGRYSALASGTEGLMASTYDGKYGDLVVFRYDTAGTRTGVDYIDGVPSGQVRYGPSGARGGIVEPGPDVGRYTDIAISGNRAFVSYYDVTNGDLKVAVREGASWSNHRVDGTSGDVGLFSSIAVDSDGLPGVAYFMRAAEASFTVSDCPAPAPTGALKDLTALKFARARVPNPTSAADWTVRVVACLSKPPPPCDGCANTCADTGTGPTCLMTGTGCMPACDMNTEVCVSVNSMAKCGKKYNPSQLVDVPLGTGVFASLAFNGKNAVIAYMQRTGPTVNGRVVPDGDLYAVQLDAQNVRSTPVLIDGVGDTGYFPDVKIEPSSRQIAIAFHDFSSKSLKFYFSARLQTGVTLETIDNGVDMARPGEQSFVGTDTAIVFGTQPGQVWAVYQDATRGDLKLARRTTAWTVQPPLATEGAVGFFADGVYANGRVWATHARLKSKLVSGQPELDNGLLLQQGPQN